MSVRMLSTERRLPRVHMVDGCECDKRNEQSGIMMAQELKSPRRDEAELGITA